MSSTDLSATTPAFAPISKNNHGPWILVAAYIFLIMSLLVIGVKLLTRWQTVRKLLWNDWIMIATAAFAIAQTVALTISVNRGLGRRSRDIKTADMIELSKAFYASNILLIAALAGAKASVTLLIISIKPSRIVMFACYGVLAFIGAWCVACIVALAVQCSPPTAWVLGPSSPLAAGTCVDQYALQIAIAATNILSDFAIIILPFFMMRTVQVNQGKKLMVSALFALRIVAPAFAIAAVVTFNPYYNSTPQDRAWYAVKPAVFTQIMLNFSIITACIPSIKRFLADIQSGLMGVNISEQYEVSHSGGKATFISYGKGTGLGTKLASRLGMTANKSMNNSGLRSRAEKDPDTIDLEEMRRNRTNIRGGKEPRERTESVKGLTDDVIMQTIDYKVEYEDNTEPSDGGRSSGGHERHDRTGLSHYDVGVGR